MGYNGGGIVGWQFNKYYSDQDISHYDNGHLICY